MMARRQVKVQTMSSDRTIEKIDFKWDPNSYMNSAISQKVLEIPIDNRNDDYAKYFDDAIGNYDQTHLHLD